MAKRNPSLYQGFKLRKEPSVPLSTIQLVPNYSSKLIYAGFTSGSMTRRVNSKQLKYQNRL